MIYTINIDVPDTEVTTLWLALAEQLGWYKETIEEVQEITVPAVLNSDWEIVEPERTTKSMVDVPNPQNILQFIWEKETDRIKRILKRYKTRVARDEAIKKIVVEDTLIDVTIS